MSSIPPAKKTKKPFSRLARSLGFSVSFLSPCFFLYLLGSFEVTVTSVSLPPFVSRRGLSNTNQRLSLKDVWRLGLPDRFLDHRFTSSVARKIR